jgi:hypothetical protein
VGTFRSYSAKPSAHFRELLECCRLLAMPAEQVVQMTADLSAVTSRSEAQAVLAGYGVSHLPVPSAAAVLAQRL